MTRKRTPNEPTEEAPTSVAEPPAAEPAADGQSFVDRVGKKQWPPIPDPFGIAKDNAAAVRLFERRDRQMAIKFGDGSAEQKPSQAVLDKVKEAGYRWDGRERVWTHPVRGGSSMSTRIDAEKLYQEVRQMIREEKGIDASPEIPM